MKTTFNSSSKDNIAISTLVVAGPFVLASGLFSGNAVVAHEAVATQKLETIVATSSRAPDAVLDTMIVTASRKIGRA